MLSAVVHHAQQYHENSTYITIKHKTHQQHYHRDY